MNKRTLLQILQLEKFYNPIFEFKFHPDRKWRFDYAWPKIMVAIEYEGIISKISRHTSYTGYTNDCTKYNHAALLGWTTLRFTALHKSNDLINILREIKKEKGIEEVTN